MLQPYNYKINMQESSQRYEEKLTIGEGSALFGVCGNGGVKVTIKLIYVALFEDCNDA